MAYIPDRQANDLRYAMVWDKIAALGYQPSCDLDEGLAATVDWYRQHPDRWAPLLRSAPAVTLPAAVSPALALVAAHAR